MQSLRIRMVIFLVLSCALAGCTGKGGGANASGSVSLNGQPLADAEVQFIPRDDASLGTHSTTTDSAGKFTVKGDRNIPLKPGPYVVIVNKLAVKEGDGKQGAGGKGAMVNTVPLMYQNRGRTPLKADIQPGSNQLPPFELTSGRTR
ncbi:MAG TPA: hypothetical protein VN688_29735 [Gemmataceae bacterium]|nr:hypothetical protein [Gemmataceae bacterium]